MFFSCYKFVCNEEKNRQNLFGSIYYLENMTGGSIKMNKKKLEELELMSKKDIAYMILSERKRSISTAALFKKIKDLFYSIMVIGI